MAMLYPGSQTHVFEGTGHTTLVTRHEDHIAVIDRFLSEPRTD
jgi:hypothetical protein